MGFAEQTQNTEFGSCQSFLKAVRRKRLGFPEQQDEGLAVVKRGILALSSLLSVGSYLSDKWDASSEHLYSVISGTLREKHAPCVTAL